MDTIWAKIILEGRGLYPPTKIPNAVIFDFVKIGLLLWVVEEVDLRTQQVFGDEWIGPC